MSQKKRKRKPYTDTSYVLLPDGTKKPMITIKSDEYGNKTIIRHMEEDERKEYEKKILKHATQIIPI